MGLADYLKTKSTRFPNWFNRFILQLNCLGEYIYGPSYQRFKRSVETIDPEEKLLEIVNYAIKHVPYYRERYSGISITSIQDFKAIIKPIDKDEVMEHWNEFITDEIALFPHVSGTTGGTSGKSLKLLFPQNRYIVEEFFSRQARVWTGRGFNLRATIRNNRLPNVKVYAVNPFTREVVFDAFRGTDEYTRKVHATICKFKIRFLFAYPSGAYEFLKRCVDLRLGVGTLKCCLLSSESITNEQWVFFKKLGLQVSITYGHSEKLILAANRNNSEELYSFPKYGYLELLSSEEEDVKEGEIGEMVGSTLYNRCMPLLRYKTGDKAEYQGQCYIEGIGTSTILSRIYGRWNMSLVVRHDDVRLPMSAINLHSTFLEKVRGLQYIQEKKGELVATIIKSEEYSEEDESFIKGFLANVMGGEGYVSIRYVDKLIYQSNGKFIQFISRLDLQS